VLHFQPLEQQRRGQTRAHANGCGNGEDSEEGPGGEQQGGGCERRGCELEESVGEHHGGGVVEYRLAEDHREDWDADTKGLLGMRGREMSCGTDRKHECLKVRGCITAGAAAAGLKLHLEGGKY
jgi:hypothetical protein